MVAINKESRNIRKRGCFAYVCGTIAVLVMTVVAGSLYMSDLNVVQQLGNLARGIWVAGPTNPRLRIYAKEDHSLAPQNQQCRYFLAESAIPSAGLGLFTAIDIKKGELAQPGPDICIYVVNAPMHTDFGSHSWSRDVFNGAFEGSYPRAACEGFATIFNAMPNEGNVATSSLRPMITHHTDNAGLHRAKHPAAGSITSYYGIYSEARRYIPAGAELTLDYGDFPFEEGRKYTAPLRTPAWLRKHGICIDNIVVQRATDSSMGRGAFARRPLRRGLAIAPLPLQIFPDEKDFHAQRPASVFINYCMRPRNSKVLAYQYGPYAGLINHSNKPNVALRWSEAPFNHQQWLSLPPDQFWEMVAPGRLILEIYALREINEGEELFMDYGREWEEAWNKHVANWKAPPNAEKYVYPEDMDPTEVLRTVKEQKERPYPANLATVCITPNWERDVGSIRKWSEPDFDWPEGVVYCHIMGRKKGRTKGEFVYQVALEFDYNKPEIDPNLPLEQMYIDTDVPRNAISWVDKPYASDMHIKTAFRQPMVMPDELVPSSWLNNNMKWVKWASNTENDDGGGGDDSVEETVEDDSTDDEENTDDDGNTDDAENNDDASEAEQNQEPKEEGTEEGGADEGEKVEPKEQVEPGNNEEKEDEGSTDEEGSKDDEVETGEGENDEDDDQAEEGDVDDDAEDDDTEDDAEEGRDEGEGNEDVDADVEDEDDEKEDIEDKIEDVEDAEETDDDDDNDDEGKDQAMQDKEEDAEDDGEDEDVEDDDEEEDEEEK